MPRGQKRVVKLLPEKIRLEIANIDAAITAKTDEIKSLRVQKKELIKDLAVAEKQELKDKEEQQMKSLVALMKEKNLTPEDIEKILSEMCIRDRYCYLS